MRAHHGFAVVAIMLILVGMKVFFFPAAVAGADTPTAVSASMNVQQMHKDHPNMKNLPVQQMHDMSFIFSDPN
jgi:hypothetical protein